MITPELHNMIRFLALNTALIGIFDPSHAAMKHLQDELVDQLLGVTAENGLNQADVDAIIALVDEELQDVQIDRQP